MAYRQIFCRCGILTEAENEKNFKSKNNSLACEHIVFSLFSYAGLCSRVGIFKFIEDEQRVFQLSF